MGKITVAMTKVKVKYMILRTLIFVCLVFFISSSLDVFEKMVVFVHKYEAFELDEIFVVAIFAVVWLLIEQLLLVAFIYKRSKIYEMISMKDSLTGLYNRRGLFVEITRAMDQLASQKKSGLLLYFDIDKFKQINDTYGHKRGDEVLMAFGDVLKDCDSRHVISGRMGGDEFVVFIKHKGAEDTLGHLEKIETGLAGLTIDADIPLVVSRGQALYPQEALTLDSLLSLADQKMYNNKYESAAVHYRKE